MASALVFSFGLVVGTGLLLAFSLALYDWILQFSYLLGIISLSSAPTWNDLARQTVLVVILGALAVALIRAAAGSFGWVADGTTGAGAGLPPGGERGAWARPELRSVLTVV